VVVTDRSVWDAEEIVRRAWTLELFRQQDRLQFAVRAAEHDCDVAHELLAAAQRDGDVRAIATAHYTLEHAMDVALRSASARERIEQALRTELDLLAKAGKARAVAVAAGRLKQDASMPSAQSSITWGVLTLWFRRVLIVLPSEGGVSRRLRRLAERRAAAPGQP
jgi:phage host-nuclease inhibitor protein Gam